MPLPFMDIVVMGIPVLSMLEPNVGAWGEHEFIDGIETQAIVFMEYVGVIGDIALAELIVEVSVEYNF